MPKGIFTDWGTKSEESSGVTISAEYKDVATGKSLGKRKETRKLKKGKRFVGESVGGVRYDKRVKVKPESAGSIGYGSRTKAQSTGGISYRPRSTSTGRVTGGISYGDRHQESTESAFGFGEGVHVHEEVKGTGGISFEKTEQPSSSKGKKKKPLFGEYDELTVSEKEEKKLIAEEKRRIKAIEQEQARKQKAELKARKARAKAQRKALSFNKQTPLAKALRKKLHRVF